MIYRVIITIRKHIATQEARSRTSIPIRIDKPTIRRIIISTLQIIEACFGIVVVASIAQGVNVCHGAGTGNDFAPCVIGVACHFLVFLNCGACVNTHQLDNIALQIQDIVVSSIATAAVGRVPQCKRITGVVIDEIHHSVTIALANDFAVLRDVGMRYAVYDLLCTDTICIIAVVVGTTISGDTRKLSALHPSQVGVGLFAVVVVQRITVFVRNRRAESASRMPRATGA